MRTVALALLMTLTACAQIAAPPTPAEVAALAPTGKLRVGVYLGNPLSAIRDPQTQALKGVGYDLGRELAARLGVPFEPVVHPAVGAVVAGIGADRWDIAVLVYSPERAKQVDFTTPIVELELGYLAAAGSALKHADEVDRSGIHVAVPAKGQGDVVLTRVLKNATLVRGNGVPGVLELVRSGKAQVAAANKPILHELSAQLPGSTLLEGRFSSEHVAFAIPKGRDVGVAYARRFIEEAKATGRVQAAIHNAGARGALVARPAQMP